MMPNDTTSYFYGNGMKQFIERESQLRVIHTRKDTLQVLLGCICINDLLVDRTQGFARQFKIIVGFFVFHIVVSHSTSTS
jgi:hypothetical protein